MHVERRPSWPCTVRRGRPNGKAGRGSTEPDRKVTLTTARIRHCGRLRLSRPPLADRPTPLLAPPLLFVLGGVAGAASRNPGSLGAGVACGHPSHPAGRRPSLLYWFAE